MSVTAAQGFVAAGVSAGLKQDGGLDLGLVYSQLPAKVAAVFTRNQVKAAPVQLSIRYLAQAGGEGRALLVNSKCANACTGVEGLRVAERLCSRSAELLGLPAQLVLPASTGVIGVLLPEEPIQLALPRLVAALSVQGGDDFAQAILTTDTFAKQVQRQAVWQGRSFTIGGCCKGSGMIGPDLAGPHATTLAFITTDAQLDQEFLQSCLEQATNESFNCVVVDGETSTNDSVYLWANGAAGVRIDRQQGGELFLRLLREVCCELAQLLVRDGEGATKFIRIEIFGAKNDQQAAELGRTIARSPLVKTAFFGEDANWGRIVAAAGYARADIAGDQLSVELQDGQDWFCLCRDSMGLAFDEGQAARILAKKEIGVRLGVGQGPGRATIYTCDLSYDYVRINGKYRS